MQQSKTNNLETATFGAGCFWHVEEAFRHLPGVKSTAAGFMGGKVKNPSYEEVSTGATGHAESVQIQYDPKEISYEKLLQTFWENHDPTTPNRQGPDIGEQYRSMIFFHTQQQEALAKQSKAELEKAGKFRKPIVTEIVPASDFYRAEEYHQQYLEKRGMSTCRM